jgi:hypothetical protein
MKTTLLAAVLFSSTALAQSALSITCSDCSAFQGIEVSVDGRPMNRGGVGTGLRVEVTPGDHEVQVWKWVNPFKREDVATQVLHFPKNVELRVRALPNKLEVYGKGDLEPVARGPSREAAGEAAELIREARDYLREAVEYNDEEDSRCQSKVAAKLEVIGDNLKDLRGNLDTALLNKTSRKLGEAQSLVESECPGRVKKTLGKKLGKIVARLDKASAALR